MEGHIAGQGYGEREGDRAIIGVDALVEIHRGAGDRDAAERRGAAEGTAESDDISGIDGEGVISINGGRKGDISRSVKGSGAAEDRWNIYGDLVGVDRSAKGDLISCGDEEAGEGLDSGSYSASQCDLPAACGECQCFARPDDRSGENHRLTTCGAGGKDYSAGERGRRGDGECIAGDAIAERNSRCLSDSKVIGRAADGASEGYGVGAGIDRDVIDECDISARHAEGCIIERDIAAENVGATCSGKGGERGCGADIAQEAEGAGTGSGAQSKGAIDRIVEGDTDTAKGGGIG